MKADLIQVVVAVEVVVVACLLLAQAVHAARITLRKRHESAVDAARTALFDAVVTDHVGPAVLLALRKLSQRQRDEVLCRVAVSVKSHRDPVFQQLAREVGTEAVIESDLLDKRWWVRSAAMRRLLVLGINNPRALALLDDPNPRVRAVAAEWLGLVVADSQSATRLVEMLGDSDDRVLHAVTTTLYGLGSSAQDALLGGLRTNDGDALRATLRVAAALGDPLVATEARPLIHDADPRNQAEAISAVTPVLTERDIPLVDALLEHPELQVRRAAARAVGTAGLRSLVGSVATNLSATDGEMRESAIRALERLGPGGELLLRRAARAPEPAND